MHDDDPKDDQDMVLEKKKEKNKMGSRQRYRQGHFVLDSRHYRECESFRIDSRTIKRGTLSEMSIILCL